jgi:hypothetical protein
LIALPGVKTATGLDCTTVPHDNGGDWTGDFDNIKCYDQLKVNAVLNWIDGKTHLGAAGAVVPKIFGMNFQAVSVGQKLIVNGVKGGYSDAAGTPTSSMLGQTFAADDTNVMLLVSNPSIRARSVTSSVETTQVAPTVLKLLGLNPRSLDAVRVEGTPVLPGFEDEVRRE